GAGSPAPHAGHLPQHDHVIFTLHDGTRIVFNDHRRFGYMDLLATASAEQSAHLQRLGPEPLGNSFHAAYLDNALEGRKSAIKAALLDQRIVAGLGNIYVCEALYRAGISPRRLSGTIPGKRSARLVPAIRDVLTRAIAAGGSSLRDYVHADGALGYFQHTFDVYDRAGQPCRREGC
ncbi:MAG: DNA-formamidopyrimidine glycosylase, partial [Pseudomonadota bacterium]